MENTLTWIIAAILLLVAGIWWKLRSMSTGRPAPAALQTGQPLPKFTAEDEQGNQVQSSQLIGTPVVLLFVRGTPFDVSSYCPVRLKRLNNPSAHGIC